MRTINVLTLAAFFSQNYAKSLAANHLDDPHDRLVERMLMAWHLYAKGLERTTLGKRQGAPSCCICPGCDGCAPLPGTAAARRLKATLKKSRGIKKLPKLRRIPKNKRKSMTRNVKVRQVPDSRQAQPSATGENQTSATGDGADAEQRLPLGRRRRTKPHEKFQKENKEKRLAQREKRLAKKARKEQRAQQIVLRRQEADNKTQLAKQIILQQQLRQGKQVAEQVIREPQEKIDIIVESERSRSDRYHLLNKSIFTDSAGQSRHGGEIVVARQGEEGAGGEGDKTEEESLFGDSDDVDEPKLLTTRQLMAKMKKIGEMEDPYQMATMKPAKRLKKYYAEVITRLRAMKRSQNEWVDTLLRKSQEPDNPEFEDDPLVAPPIIRAQQEDLAKSLYEQITAPDRPLSSNPLPITYGGR
eukprot:gnl/TRDRNA2_/TRDRNA2_29432_c0_seq1.p1 gnl/TRDRNA2_/TRDRNA2_29432_c0~~gnl/TRDRNA2_/TRDRNA2_29432_c0_seq1.p1  ORF type:complete len:415 (+),score=68.20 gnl/TRDRNA2_/TRDRNA2_29432_c0_seq1:95-1339(+)